MRSARAVRRASALLVVVTAVSAASFPARATDSDGTSQQARGAAVFSRYCVLCHGYSGKGDGRAAALQKVPPADLTASRRSDEYRLHIVRDGGASMNRSDAMPAWGEVLSGEQIEDVVAYLRVIASKPVEPAKQAAAAIKDEKR